MKHLLVFSALLTTGFALPWPSLPMDSVHPIGTAWGNYLDFGPGPYCHNGQDIMVPAQSPSVAIRPGYVKKVWFAGSPMYNGVTVADSAGAAFCCGYMYYHVDDTTIQVQEGDTVQTGDTLGYIATWNAAGYHHNHFSANRYSGVIWSDYGEFYRNPLLDLLPDDDSTVPTFIHAYSGQRFAICLDNTSSYQSKDSVHGTVDLICRLDDKVNHRVWKTAVYRIDYSIRDTFGTYVVPLKRAVEMSHSIDSYSGPFQSRAVYKQDATCKTRCNYDSLARQYYYIMTNTDGDSLIEPSDSLGNWNTTLSPDGNYWVKVIARDEHGNTAVDSMMVKLRNDTPGVSEAALAGGEARIEVAPNPGRGKVRFLLSGAAATAGLRIFDASGRSVRCFRSSGSRLVWDGRDERGRLLPGGVYFCRAGGQRDGVELVLLR
jgi:hypothetical protein